MPFLNDFFLLFDPHSGEMGEFLAGLAALIAVGITVWQYFVSKNQRKFELADRLITELERNEMLKFALACTDWGGGLIPVPSSWAPILKNPIISHDLPLFYKALRWDLTPDIANNPQAMLYRHAFVALFDHLERIYFFLMQRSIRRKDLVSLIWLTRDLSCWPYAGPDDDIRKQFFMEAAETWYTGESPKKLIETLNGLGERMRKQRHDFRTMVFGKS